MFLGGNQAITVGGSEPFTLDRDVLATVAGGLGDGYYGTKEFWREVLCNFQASTVLDSVEKIGNGTFDSDISGWGGTYGTWDPSQEINVINGLNGPDYANYVFPTFVGVTYNVSATVTGVGPGAQAGIHAMDSTEDNRNGVKLGEATSGTTGPLSFSFVANTTSSKIVLATEVINDSSQWDNISVTAEEPVNFGAVGPRKTLKFKESDIDSISFSNTAPIGTYELKNVVIIDKDHGQFVIKKADIPNQSFYNIVVS